MDGMYDQMGSLRPSNDITGDSVAHDVELRRTTKWSGRLLKRLQMLLATSETETKDKL